jgi:hypothetical protein
MALKHFQQNFTHYFCHLLQICILSLARFRWKFISRLAAFNFEIMHCLKILEHCVHHGHNKVFSCDAFSE